MSCCCVSGYCCQLVESEQLVLDLSHQLSAAETSNREVNDQLRDMSKQLVLVQAELERVGVQNSSMAEEVS